MLRSAGQFPPARASLLRAEEISGLRDQALSAGRLAERGCTHRTFSPALLKLRRGFGIGGTCGARFNSPFFSGAVELETSLRPCGNSARAKRVDARASPKLPRSPPACRWTRSYSHTVAPGAVAPPCDEGVVKYAMARPFAGYVDVLYLDGDVRVGRGNRGSPTVVRRERGGALGETADGALDGGG